MESFCILLPRCSFTDPSSKCTCLKISPLQTPSESRERPSQRFVVCFLIWIRCGTSEHRIPIDPVEKALRHWLHCRTDRNRPAAAWATRVRWQRSGVCCICTESLRMQQRSREEPPPPTLSWRIAAVEGESTGRDLQYHRRPTPARRRMRGGAEGASEP